MGSLTLTMRWGTFSFSYWEEVSSQARKKIIRLGYQCQAPPYSIIIQETENGRWHVAR
ncbi:unnamed protein product [Brassica rapa subsp. trilocularis]